MCFVVKFKANIESNRIDPPDEPSTVPCLQTSHTPRTFVAEVSRLCKMNPILVAVLAALIKTPGWRSRVVIQQYYLVFSAQPYLSKQNAICGPMLVFGVLKMPADLVSHYLGGKT